MQVELKIIYVNSAKEPRQVNMPFDGAIPLPSTGESLLFYDVEKEIRGVVDHRQFAYYGSHVDVILWVTKDANV